MYIKCWKSWISVDNFSILNRLWGTTKMSNKPISLKLSNQTYFKTTEFHSKLVLIFISIFCYYCVHKYDMKISMYYKKKECTNQNTRGLFKVCQDLIFDVYLKRITDVLKHKNIRLKQQKFDDLNSYHI